MIRCVLQVCACCERVCGNCKKYFKSNKCTRIKGAKVHRANDLSCTRYTINITVGYCLCCYYYLAVAAPNRARAEFTKRQYNLQYKHLKRDLRYSFIIMTQWCSQIEILGKDICDFLSLKYREMLRVCVTFLTYELTLTYQCSI